MKHIARKITVFLLSAIVLTTMLPSYAHAAVAWYDVPTDIMGVIPEDGAFGLVLVCTASATSPTESYYLKLTCVEDSTEDYYGTIDYGAIGSAFYLAVDGLPMQIRHTLDPDRVYPPAGVYQIVYFTSPIVEIGKHYIVQLVKSSDGGATYTAVGDPSVTIEIVAPPEVPTVPEHPYWWSCYTKIKELGESNDPQTLVYEEGTALPIEIMQALQECPNVTLIFKCSYDGTDYEFTIPGDQAIVISDIPWYGPLWLNQHYSKKKHLVVPGDTLSKIAATYHTTVDSLLSKNAFIRDKDKIYVGQMINY